MRKNNALNDLLSEPHKNPIYSVADNIPGGTQLFFARGNLG